METLNFFFSALCQVAFPIVCSMFCFWYLVRKDDETKETIANMEERHNAEISGLEKAINENTLVLTRLLERLDK